MLSHVLGLVIIPRDRVTKTGWKNLSFEYLANKSDVELQKCLESHAYMYDEVVVKTKYPVDHHIKLANTASGLIQLLQSQAGHYTFSSENSQTISLNGSLGYFIAISDPDFAVVSANPETIPRTLINLPPGGGLVQIYLTVIFSIHNFVF